jgi:hypothetical protein
LYTICLSLDAIATQKLLSSMFSSASKMEREENVEHEFAICFFDHACIMFNYYSLFFEFSIPMDGFS